jgi:hypothetical protein
MTLRRIKLSAVAVVLTTFFLTFGLAPPSGLDVTAGNTATAEASSAPHAANWTFEGCWTQFSSGPCRDVFRDQQGNYWICRACGTTGNPGPGKCTPISPATLATGFWCS